MQLSFGDKLGPYEILAGAGVEVNCGYCTAGSLVWSPVFRHYRMTEARGARAYAAAASRILSCAAGGCVASPDTASTPGAGRAVAMSPVGLSVPVEGS